MYEVMFKQTRGKYKRNCSPRQVLAEELGYRKEFSWGGVLRFVAIAFLVLFKSLHVKIPGSIAKVLGIHHHPIMTHTSSGMCVRVGASMFIVFWLNYQVGLQSSDYFAPHPFLKIYVSNMPKKHLNLSIPPHPQYYSQSQP